MRHPKPNPIHSLIARIINSRGSALPRAESLPAQTHCRHGAANRGALAALARPDGHMSGSGDRATGHSARPAYHPDTRRLDSAPRRAAEAAQQGGGIISSEWRPAPGQLRSDPWRGDRLDGPSKSTLVSHLPSGGDSGRFRHRAAGTLPSGAAEGRQRQQPTTANASRLGGVLSGRGRSSPCQVHLSRHMWRKMRPCRSFCIVYACRAWYVCAICT